jgi:hypothetical protein
MATIKSVLLLLPVLTLVACASTKTNLGAEKVRVVTETPKECEFLGQVIGSQGNWFAGPFTSNRALEEGAMNDLINKTHKLGGDTLHLLTNRAGVTGSGSGSSSQTNVTMTGGAYKCY